jgi:hypothetical protein
MMASKRGEAKGGRAVNVPNAPSASRALDPLLVAACERLGVDPQRVLAWGLRRGVVVVILPDGRKLECAP